MRVRIENSVDESEWDGLVASSPWGNIFQSSAWATFEKDYLRVRSFFFIVEESSGGKPLAILRAGRESPFNRHLFERPLNRLTVPLADRLSANLSWQGGPLFLEPEKRQESL